MDLKEIIDIFLEAIEIIYIIEFCEPRPENFDDMYKRVKQLASACDEQLDKNPELDLAVTHCRMAIAAEPLSIERQRELERSLCTTPDNADRLEEHGLLGWQKRAAREKFGGE